MPRLMHWVARVWRRAWGWTCDAGAAGDGGDVAVDGAAVHRLVVVAFDEQAGRGRPAPGAVVVDQPDEHRVQRDGAFVVQFAERDAQPVGVAEAIHGVVA